MWLLTFRAIFWTWGHAANATRAHYLFCTIFHFSEWVTYFYFYSYFNCFIKQLKLWMFLICFALGFTHLKEKSVVWVEPMLCVGWPQLLPLLLKKKIHPSPLRYTFLCVLSLLTFTLARYVFVIFFHHSFIMPISHQNCWLLSFTQASFKLIPFLNSFIFLYPSLTLHIHF